MPEPPSAALAAFLRDRRSRIGPADVGLPVGERRRVPGLRREEVAQLAGLSVDYYSRLEQGRQKTASPAVLASVANTLRLTKDERQHLFTLAGALDEEPLSSGHASLGDRHHRLFAVFGDTPAMMVGPFLDIVYANNAASLLFADFDAMPPPHRNGLRWMLLAPEARELYGEGWPEATGEMIGMLRLDAGRMPESRRLAQLVQEFTAESEFFRPYWEGQAVSSRLHEEKILSHPDFGEMSFFNEFITAHWAPEHQIVLIIPADERRFGEALAKWRQRAARDGLDKSGC